MEAASDGGAQAVADDAVGGEGRPWFAGIGRNRRRRQRCSSSKFTQPGGIEGEASEGKERGYKGD